MLTQRDYYKVEIFGKTRRNDLLWLNAYTFSWVYLIFSDFKYSSISHHTPDIRYLKNVAIQVNNIYTNDKPYTLPIFLCRT